MMMKELVDRLYPKRRDKQSAADEARIADVTKDLKRLKTRLTPLEKLTLRTEIAQLMLYGELRKQYAQTYYTVAKNNCSFREDMRTLLGVPGIGSDTAAAVLAEIVDVSSYFKSPEKLVKWAGSAPKIKKKLSRKIQSFERHLDRCLKAQEALTWTINNQLNMVSYKGQDPKELLRLLLAAV